MVREELLSPKEPTPKQISQMELDNRLRLIGVLVDILTNKEVKQRFSSQNELITHIQDKYEAWLLSPR